MTSLFDLAKDGDELTFHSPGINWIWYCTVKVVWPYGHMNAEILKHWRVHKGEDGHPDTVGSYELLENSERTACAVHMMFNEGPDTYAAVENPKQVFSY